MIKEHRIPARGSKQVGLIGNEEKRAFTTLLAVSAAGDLLPPQCVYEGKTDRSTPSSTATNHKECDAAGFRFVFSGKASNHSMRKRIGCACRLHRGRW